MTPDDVLLFAHVQESVDELTHAGLYAKASHPLDWENSRSRGQNPHLIRGGTHREVQPLVNIVHGSFLIELTPEGFKVSGECAPQGTFPSLAQATAYVTLKWIP